VNVETSLAYLYESSSKQLVPAELLDAITEQQLIDWEDQWIPAREAGLERLRANRIDRKLWPQSRHWNWRGKAVEVTGSLANPCFSVVCDGFTQGMMILDTLPSARETSQAGKPLIYIDYLEIAPWNYKYLPSDVRRYQLVGSILMRAAVEVSLQEGFKGRIGLHSLPQSNDWYANKCGMIDLGVDAAKQNLRYFEMTPAIAQAYIAEGSKP
jgi:hypothetical protein